MPKTANAETLREESDALERGLPGTRRQSTPVRSKPGGFPAHSASRERTAAAP